MNSPHNFTDDYFLLKPEEASFFDVFRLLFSSDLETTGLVVRRFPEQRYIRSFSHNWIVRVSLLVQMLLLWCRTPMALVGYVLEFWLNLFSGNGGFFNLLLNLVTCKLWWPNRASAKFASVIGHIDTRVELDKNIKPGNEKYKAALSMMAAKISYENETFIETNITQHWKMKFLKFYNNFWNGYLKCKSTPALMLQDTRSNPNLIVVAFRGTEPFDADDWRTDVDLSWYKLKGLDWGKTHRGFMHVLGLQKKIGWPKQIQQCSDLHQYAYYTLREKLREVLQENPDAKFILTGHSLGGALAILFAAVLMFHEEEWLSERLDGVYTFGQPRVGDDKFGEIMEEKMRKFDVKYFKYVYSYDIVPRLPFDDKLFWYKDFGTCLYVDSFYKEKRLPEEPDKNYFSLKSVFPKMVNAKWELLRGFIMPYIVGPDYKEGWFLRMWRMIGLVVPGLSDHCPQDYVNSSRLACLPSGLALDPLIDNELKTD
ncbi:hypothetical protein DITRI_Ditri03aG0192700 [Diplodiscus trichospermus]